MFILDDSLWSMNVLVCFSPYLLESTYSSQVILAHQEMQNFHIPDCCSRNNVQDFRNVGHAEMIAVIVRLHLGQAKHLIYQAA